MLPIDALKAFRCALTAERRTIVSEALATRDMTVVIESLSSLQSALNAVDRALDQERRHYIHISPNAFRRTSAR